MTNGVGKFYGIGVGPGPVKMLPVAALEALKTVDLIFAPRARSSDYSIAKECLAGLDIGEDRFREIVFNMDPERDQIISHYEEIAGSIVDQLRVGKSVAYLTIGDSLTYSTYSYTLAAIEKLLPGFAHQTFPGITSYAAASALVDFPLGQGKERTLILPCPDDAQVLRTEIESHDIVVLMKIGKRFSMVIDVLNEMNIASHCALVSRLGLKGEIILDSLAVISASESLGYLTTMLIRKTPFKGGY